jgi:hypothetical protein
VSKSRPFEAGTRVIYTERSGKQRVGTVRETAGKFVDVALDGMQKRTFFVPIDTLTLLPPELDERNTE